MSTKQRGQHTKYRGLTSRQVNRLSPSGIRRFFDLLASMEGVISLGVGEPDFATPWHVREAAIRSLQGSGLYITGIRDVTPISHAGCRPPKRRRV